MPTPASNGQNTQTVRATAVPVAFPAISCSAAAAESIVEPVRHSAAMIGHASMKALNWNDETNRIITM